MAALIIALSFAFATNRVWEDYWITVRSSENLVEGKGLVYHAGERVHTFTSPLGALLPALCHWVSARDTETALWIFRVMGALAFAAAAALMFETAKRLQIQPAMPALLVLALMLDAKSVDFSINGMETGFMLLFVSLMLSALFACERRVWLHFGLACGGLMWTRPDGVIYIFAISVGSLLFVPQSRTRGGQVRMLGAATLACAVIYLPWFLWAWSYYGSPVPHTIIAKGNAVGELTLLGALQTWLMLPVSMFCGGGSLDGLFMPSYALNGGWPIWMTAVMRFFAGLPSPLCAKASPGASFKAST